MIRPKQRRSPPSLSSTASSHSTSSSPRKTPTESPLNASHCKNSPRKISPSSLLVQTGSADGPTFLSSPRKTMSNTLSSPRKTMNNTLSSRRSASPRKQRVLTRRRSRRRSHHVLWPARNILRLLTFLVALFLCTVFATISFLRYSRATSSKQQQQRQNHNHQQQQHRAGVFHPDKPATTTTKRTATAFRLNTPTAPRPCEPLPSAEHVDFTLVTQFSENRLWMMEYHCQRWNDAGPISIAVFTNRTTQQVQQDLTGKLGCSANLLTVHTVAPNTNLSEEDYPVNLLRNTALSTVQTSHVVYVDIDFWESTDLPDTLQYHTELLASDPQTALVLPAFQLNRQCREWRECPEDNIPVMPTNKKELLDLVYQQRASTFDPTNVGGHGSTRYLDWFDQTVDELVPIECFKSNRYEPYLVFRYCRDLPPFQESFTGYGKNKMTWVMQLRRMGWQFQQIGESFVVHYPHLDSKARMHWNGGKDGVQLQRPKTSKHVDWLAFKRGQIDHTFVDFRKWLHDNVADESVVPMCSDAMNDDVRLWIDR